MYVIGTTEWSFLNVELKHFMIQDPHCEIYSEVKKVLYKCNLKEATIYSAYEDAAKIIEEIKKRKNEIIFEDIDVIRQILDEKDGEEFDADKLKIYELIPTAVCV